MMTMKILSVQDQEYSAHHNNQKIINCRPYSTDCYLKGVHSRTEFLIYSRLLAVPLWIVERMREMGVDQHLIEHLT